jgi:post-segregation antitoxin (ccd killing protein)
MLASRRRFIAAGSISGWACGHPVASVDRGLTVRYVYTMRMARVNVYLPDDLAAAARAAGLNVSGITQAALTAALAERDTNRWLDSIARMHSTGVTHDQALAAVHAAREEMGSRASQ